MVMQDLFFLGLILNLPICQDGRLGQEIKKEMARVARKALMEFKVAKKDRNFVKRLLRREVELPMKQTQMDTMHGYVDKFRDGFAGYIVHRTIRSLDWEGKPISGLPPFHEQVLALQPSQPERKALKAMANEILRDDNATKVKYINKADNVSPFILTFRFLTREPPRWTRPGRVQREGLRPLCDCEPPPRWRWTRPGRVQREGLRPLCDCEPPPCWTRPGRVQRGGLRPICECEAAPSL